MREPASFTTPAETAAQVPAATTLRRGELLVWRGSRRARLLVVEGRAWVTRPDDLLDHFLGPGASLCLPRGAHVLIGAETDVTLRLQPIAARPWKRLLRPVSGAFAARA